ncbi:hypothetical protein ACQUY5_16540 [Bacillus cereus]|uniref:hypothetical protein n=1 Tax=Bacillus cereus TaxID=1396 RepID=UPI003D1831F9
MANKGVFTEEEINQFLKRDKPHYGIVITETMQGEVADVEVYDTDRHNIIKEFYTVGETQALAELLKWLTNKGLQFTEESRLWVDKETGYTFRYYIIEK